MDPLCYVCTSEPTSGPTPETSARIHKSQCTCFKVGPASRDSAPRKDIFEHKNKSDS